MHRFMSCLTRLGLVGLIATAATCGTCLAADNADARLIPVIDGSGALGEATGPNGAMSGSTYVPERQATHPQGVQPRYPQRARGRFDGYRHSRPHHYRGQGHGGYRGYGRGYQNGYRGYGGYNNGGIGIAPGNSTQPFGGRPVSPDRQQLQQRFGG